MFDFLGVEVNTDKQSGKVTLAQGGLTKKVLKKVGMLDSNKTITPESTIPLVTDSDGPPFDEPWEYASVVVMLMYLSINSRPGMQFSVHYCDRFTYNPSRSHVEAVNSICRYLVGTQGQVFTFDPNIYMMLECYVNAYFAGLCKHKCDQDHLCVSSRNGYVMTLGGYTLRWLSKLHK